MAVTLSICAALTTCVRSLFPLSLWSPQLSPVYSEVSHTEFRGTYSQSKVGWLAGTFPSRRAIELTFASKTVSAHSWKERDNKIKIYFSTGWWKKGREGVGEGIDTLQRAISPMDPVRHTLGKLVSQDGYHGHMNQAPSLLSVSWCCMHTQRSGALKSPTLKILFFNRYCCFQYVTKEHILLSFFHPLSTWQQGLETQLYKRKKHQLLKIFYTRNEFIV